MSEHRTEMRMREIGDSFCPEPGCEYEGKPAVQGHCFSRLPDATDKLLARMEKRAEESLAFYKEQYHGEEYVRVLESMYLCAMMNWDGALDQLVRLRRENAKLKPEGSAAEGA